MPREPVVFLGPTLARTRARALLDVDYRPPIKRGDLKGMLGDPPRLIGIIDGEFFQSLSVSTKEILPFLEAGVTVVGASSMGALRAVELERYGMIGIGRIFQMFQTGVIDADDEVAVTYSPETYVTSSVPLVNYRIALADAGVISPAASKRLIGIMKRLYFPERTERRFWREAEVALSGEELCALQDYFERERPDAKSMDALELLGTVRDRLATLHVQAPLAVKHE
ncbi:MAG: TfuA-like protein [Acidobacteriota bacterium]|nr:TfuA-like protein [Acidobacteriota bacterium]